MKATYFILCLLALVAVSCSRAPRVCPVCQRAECVGMAFRETLADGRTVETCCPKCGLHYLHNSKQAAVRMEATDYVSGKWIDAKKAVYVSGSDVNHCAPVEAKRDAYGCCYFKGYDRCMPSLIAFADRPAADTFQKQHGGQIIGFDQISSD